MKALIREEGETVTEDMEIPGINWTTGYPLTAPGWAGGPYILVSDYVPEDSADDGFDPSPAHRNAKGAVQAPPAQAPAAAPVLDPPADTIVIDGVTYVRTS